jgi:hypothetical protein
LARAQVRASSATHARALEPLSPPERREARSVPDPRSLRTVPYPRLRLEEHHVLAVRPRGAARRRVPGDVRCVWFPVGLIRRDALRRVTGPRPTRSSEL